MLVGCVLQLAWCRAGGRGCCANLRACWGHKTRKKSAASKAPKCRLLPLKRHCALHLHCWLIYVPLKLRALSRASSHECGGAEGSMARRGQICAQEGAGGRQGRGWEGWGGAARRERHHVASGKVEFLSELFSCSSALRNFPIRNNIENIRRLHSHGSVLLSVLHCRPRARRRRKCLAHAAAGPPPRHGRLHSHRSGLHCRPRGDVSSFCCLYQ